MASIELDRQELNGWLGPPHLRWMHQQTVSIGCVTHQGTRGKSRAAFRRTRDQRHASSSALAFYEFGIKEPGRIGPVVAVTQRTTSARKWTADLCFDPNATPSRVKRLGCGVLIEHPEVEGSLGPKSAMSPCGL